MTQLGTTGTVYTELMAFTHAPDPPANVVTDWYTNPAPPNPELDTVGVFDFKYPISQLAYSRGSDGKPLGALTWFGMPLTSVEQSWIELPSAFRLYDNYPNPFNPETNIRFDLPQGADVLLEVFNVVGQRVATLVNGRLEAGPYAVRWSGAQDDGTRLSSGIYLYRLSANGMVAVKKMALVK
jgi:hypothetical protein